MRFTKIMNALGFPIGFIFGLLVGIAITALVLNGGGREAQTEQAVADDWENSDQIIKSRDWGADESEILAQVAMYYARDESIETKMLVVLTCLNRMWTQLADGEQTNVQMVASEMTHGYYASYNPTEECYKAVGRVQYDGWDESEGALYICLSEDTDADEEMCRAGHEFLYASGRYNFYK